jgi:hypothetical protein
MAATKRGDMLRRRSARTWHAASLVLGGLLVFQPSAFATGSWELTLTLSTRSALPGEPILVAGTMTYRGTEPFLGFAGFGRSSLTYTAPSGRRLGGWDALWFGGPADAPPPARAQTYADAWDTSAEILLLYDSWSGSYVLLEPGTGKLELSAEIWQGTALETYRPLRLTTEPLPVTVAPLPDSERQAFALWCGRDKANMFLTERTTPSAEADLRTLVERHPSSAYAKYGLLALARARRGERHRLRPGPAGKLSPEQRETRKRLAAEEIGLLEQVMERYGVFHLTPLVLDELVEAAQAVGDRVRIEKCATMLLGIRDAPKSFQSRAKRALESVRRREAESSSPGSR